MREGKGPEIWQRNVAALCIVQFLTMLSYSFVFPFVPLYVQTFGVGGPIEAAQWAAIIGAAGALSMVVSQPVWGGLADRWGRKPMVVRSMAGNGIITLLMGFATSPEQLVALRFIQGAVTGTITASNALAASSTPSRRLGYALGIMQIGFFVGSSVGPFVGGVFADTFGYRSAFVSAGLLVLLGVPISIKMIHEDKASLRARTSPRGIFTESRLLLASSTLPALIGVIFLIQVGGLIVTPVLSLFIAELSGGENAATAAGVIVAAMGAVSAVSAVAIGRISDRVGRTTILSVCLLGAAISYFPQAFVHGFWDLLLLRMLLGVFLGGMMPVANSLVAEVVPMDRRGAAFGLAAMATAMSNAVAPLSAAAIATQWGIRAVFLATGILFTLNFGWVSIVLRKNSLSRPQSKQETLATDTHPPRGNDSGQA